VVSEIYKFTLFIYINKIVIDNVACFVIFNIIFVYSSIFCCVYNTSSNKSSKKQTVVDSYP